jgi:hypothetical protein
LERSASGLTFATQASSQTVYWLKVEVPKKWLMGFPSDTREKRVVFLSDGIKPLLQLYTSVSQTLVFPRLHFGHFLHSAIQTGSTLSPTFRSVISRPTLSTNLSPSNSRQKISSQKKCKFTKIIFTKIPTSLTLLLHGRKCEEITDPGPKHTTYACQYHVRERNTCQFNVEIRCKKFAAKGNSPAPPCNTNRYDRSPHS